nr:divalent cation tolerance protein CutA [Streptomyces roseochromogenus]
MLFSVCCWSARRGHADRYAELEGHRLEHHPWKNPELVAVPIVAGSDAYLRWVDAVLGTHTSE